MQSKTPARAPNQVRSPSRSLPRIDNRAPTAAGHFKFSRCHLHLALRGFTVESPLQLVAVDLISALEHLPEHGELRGAVPGELCRDLDAPLPGFPLTYDQVLGAGTEAGGETQEQACNHEIHFHVYFPEISREERCRGCEHEGGDTEDCDKEK